MDKMEEIKKPDLNREETEILIKSIVIATKRDVIVSSLNNEFKKQAGYHIRYESFGYTSLEKFLESIEGVTLELNCYGSNVVKVETINSRHIRELVRNQKSPVKRRKKRNKSAPGRTGTYEDSPPGNLEKAKCKSIYKSHTNLSSESSEKFEEREAGQKSKTTTMNPDEDTRRYPFVVINQESDIENVEDLEENGVTELKLKPKLCGLRSSAFDQNKRRKIEDTKCVRFEPDAEECEECTCPALAQYTLVGDDWFFNLAKDVLKSFVCKTPFGEMIGINKKKLTIFDATKYLSLRKYLPEKFVLLIGATDLLEGKLFEVIAYDMYGLIGQILKQNITLAVCTIPPIFSKKIHNKEIYSNFLKFNELIKCIPEDYNDSVEIIDLYALFTRGSDLKMNFRLNEYFCPENDEGCIPKMNEKGKKLLKTILVSYLS